MNPFATAILGFFTGILLFSIFTKLRYVGFRKVVQLKDVNHDWITYGAYWSFRYHCWCVNLYWFATDSGFPLKLEDDGTCTILMKSCPGYGKQWAGIKWRQLNAETNS